MSAPDIAAWLGPLAADRKSQVDVDCTMLDVEGTCYLQDDMYRQISNIRLTKSQNLIVSHLVLKLFLCNILKPCVKSKMKM